MILLDASVIIAYLDGEHTHHARSEKLLAREIDEDFGADSLTLAQVLVMPDCCVLLAAEHAGARVASFDDQLTKAAIARQLETVSH